MFCENFSPVLFVTAIVAVKSPTGKYADLPVVPITKFNEFTPGTLEAMVAAADWKAWTNVASKLTVTFTFANVQIIFAVTSLPFGMVTCAEPA